MFLPSLETSHSSRLSILDLDNVSVSVSLVLFQISINSNGILAICSLALLNFLDAKRWKLLNCLEIKEIELAYLMCRFWVEVLEQCANDKKNRRNWHLLTSIKTLIHEYRDNGIVFFDNFCLLQIFHKIVCLFSSLYVHILSSNLVIENFYFFFYCKNHSSCYNWCHQNKRRIRNQS